MNPSAIGQGSRATLARMPVVNPPAQPNVRTTDEHIPRTHPVVRPPRVPCPVARSRALGLLIVALLALLPAKAALHVIL